MRDRVILTIPHRCTLARADEFLREKKTWLLQEIEALPPRVPLFFDATLPVLGKEIKLVTADRKSRAKNALPILATPSRCEETVKRILKRKLLEYITPRAERYAAGIGKEIRKIRLVDTSTRFASCTTSGMLSFSWRLVFAPRPVIDYIIAHEVAHLREMHHGPRFWALTEELNPHFERHRAWLKTEGITLFRYGNTRSRS